MGSRDDEICAVLTSVAMAGDGIVLGLGIAVLAVRTWFKYRAHSKALKEIEETPLSEIADLRSLVQRNEGVSDDGCKNLKSSTWSISKEKTSNETSSWTISREGGRRKQQHIPPLVIVRGFVQTRAAVESAGQDDVLVAGNAGEKAVFTERIQTYLYDEWRGFLGWGHEWRGLFGWGSMKEQITVSRRMVPFVLSDADLHRNPAFAHINIDELHHSLPLVTIYHHIHPVQASSYTFFQAMFGSRYPIGLLEEEKILSVGKELTAVGILTTAPDGHPVLKSCSRLPCFLTEYTRDQLINEIALGTKVLFWTGIVLSTLAATILGYAVAKNWRRWKDWRQQQLRQEAAARQEQLLAEEIQEETGDVPDGELCVVCLLHRRRAAFVSCGHRVCCLRCAHRVEQDANPRCPVCRQTVAGVIRIFDA